MTYRLVRLNPCLRLKVHRYVSEERSRIHVGLDARSDPADVLKPAQSLDMERRHIPALIASLQAVYDDTRPGRRQRATPNFERPSTPSER